jgi:hypothetical protein
MKAINIKSGLFLLHILGDLKLQDISPSTGAVRSCYNSESSAHRNNVRSVIFQPTSRQAASIIHLYQLIKSCRSLYKKIPRPHSPQSITRPTLPTEYTSAMSETSCNKRATKSDKGKGPKSGTTSLDANPSDPPTSPLSEPPSDTELDRVGNELRLEEMRQQGSARAHASSSSAGRGRTFLNLPIPASSTLPSSPLGDDEISENEPAVNPGSSRNRRPAATQSTPSSEYRSSRRTGRQGAELEALLELPAEQPEEEYGPDNPIGVQWRREKYFGQPPKRKKS